MVRTYWLASYFEEGIVIQKFESLSGPYKVFGDDSTYIYGKEIYGDLGYQKHVINLKYLNIVDNARNYPIIWHNNKETMAFLKGLVDQGEEGSKKYLAILKNAGIEI